MARHRGGRVQSLLLRESFDVIDIRALLEQVEQSIVFANRLNGTAGRQ
jgi:hypothetical protein